MTTTSPFDPIVALFRNRIFVTSVVAAILAVGIALYPPLTDFKDELLTVLVIIVLSIAGGEITGMLTTASVMKAQLGVQAAQYQLEAARVQSMQSARG